MAFNISLRAFIIGMTVDGTDVTIECICYNTYTLLMWFTILFQDGAANITHLCRVKTGGSAWRSIL